MRRLLLVIPLAAGCATVGGTASDVRRVREALAESERARGELVRRVDELENRVTLLTDRLDHLRDSGAPRAEAPRLPVVTLRPAPPPSEAEVSVEETSEPAAADDRPPIKLRMAGTPQRASSPASSGARPAAAPVSSSPATTVSTGGLPNLGVVKLPDRGVPVGHVGESPASEADAAAIYQKGHAALRGGQYEQAEASFRDFVRRWPRHENADNAQYWLAESHYARKDYRAAVVEFRYVVERWPDGNKTPDAQLKLGYTLIALGDEAGGRKALSQVVARYPGTDAARLAERRLAELAPTEKNR